MSFFLHTNEQYKLYIYYYLHAKVLCHLIIQYSIAILVIMERFIALLAKETW